MKKLIILLLLLSFGFTSCGPRRYKCGPYRKCEVMQLSALNSSYSHKTVVN